MTREEREQYEALKKLAQQEEHAEQARIRRAAKRWIQDRWGMSAAQLDKVVAQYKESQKRRQLAAAQQQGKPPVQPQRKPEAEPTRRPAQPGAQQYTPKGAEGAGTSAGGIGRNTMLHEPETWSQL